MGPTASGKTALAEKLFKAQESELISVDSSLVYQGMDIGTAKPNSDELKQFPHHLVDILSPKEVFSASMFREQALGLCHDIIKRKNMPICVGGTMLYFNAFQKGLDNLPSSQPEVRAKLLEKLKLQGVTSLHDELKSCDKIAAKKIHAHDKQRVLRALEVFIISGKPISSFWLASKKQPSPFEFINIGLMPSNRAKLHQLIEQRFDTMLELGFIEEVRQLMAQGVTLDMPSMRAVGYRQVFQYINGEYDFQSMREKALAATRQLAKRQMTWLRHYEPIHLFEPFDGQLLEHVLKMI